MTAEQQASIKTILTTAHQQAESRAYCRAVAG